MSTCISRHGEYGSHEIGSGEDEFTCQRCSVFDEGAALAALRDARAEVERQRARADAAERMLAYQLPMAEAELAAERAKVERVRALRTEWAQRRAEDRNHELWRALGVALAGDEQ